jgi:hypothetical protein
VEKLDQTAAETPVAADVWLGHKFGFRLDMERRYSQYYTVYSDTSRNISVNGKDLLGSLWLNEADPNGPH